MVDVETSGLSTRRHRILQIGVVTVEPDGTVGRAVGDARAPAVAVEPGRPAPGPRHHPPPPARRATDGRRAATSCAGRLDGAVFTAHNAEFDAAFIERAARRSGVPLTLDRRLCTLQLSRRLDPDRQLYPRARRRVRPLRHPARPAPRRPCRRHAPRPPSSPTCSPPTASSTRPTSTRSTRNVRQHAPGHVGDRASATPAGRAPRPRCPRRSSSRSSQRWLATGKRRHDAAVAELDDLVDGIALDDPRRRRGQPQRDLRQAAVGEPLRRPPTCARRRPAHRRSPVAHDRLEAVDAERAPLAGAPVVGDDVPLAAVVEHPPRRDRALGDLVARRRPVLDAQPLDGAHGRRRSTAMRSSTAGGTGRSTTTSSSPSAAASFCSPRPSGPSGRRRAAASPPARRRRGRSPPGRSAAAAG